MPPKLIKPVAKKRHLRILVFGRDKVGKTHLALSGPNPALFSCEGRYESFIDIYPNMMLVPHSEQNLFHDARQATEWAMDGQYEGIETFVMDSYTVLEKAKKGTLDMDLDESKTRAQNLGRRREVIEDDFLDMLKGTTNVHVVFIAHEANEWADGGGTALKTTGKRPDATRNIEHYFDICLHLQYDRQTRTRTATIRRSNYAHLLPEGMTIKNPTWAMFNAIINPQVVGGGATPALAAGRRTQPPQAQPATLAPTNEGANTTPVTALLSNADLLKLYAEAGCPAGPKLSNWFAANRIAVVDGKNISDDDRKRAGDILTKLAAAATRRAEAQATSGPPESIAS